ncbi:hypothetical protein BDQ17DRAFT_647595 [Cyathus striatus]|nr:hypothetical protein BDQ17DRAFT_647595 [Cyathus striatus]
MMVVGLTLSSLSLALHFYPTPTLVSVILPAIFLIEHEYSSSAFIIVLFPSCKVPITIPLSLIIIIGTFVFIPPPTLITVVPPTVLLIECEHSSSPFIIVLFLSC